MLSELHNSIFNTDALIGTNCHRLFGYAHTKSGTGERRDVETLEQERVEGKFSEAALKNLNESSIFYCTQIDFWHLGKKIRLLLRTLQLWSQFRVQVCAGQRGHAGHGRGGGMRDRRPGRDSGG